MQCQALSRAGRWALALLFFITSTAAAQVRIVGAITGTVIDTAGLAVPGARVQLKDERTGIQKETTPTNRGSFAFPDLNFGTYQVTVSPGFPDARSTTRSSSNPDGRRTCASSCGRRARRGHHRRGRVARARDDVEHHLEHAEQQGRQRAAARRPQRVQLRACWCRARARRRARAARTSTACRAARSTRRSTASTTRPTASRAAAPASSAPCRRGSARSRRSPSKPPASARTPAPGRRQPEVRHAPRHEPVSRQRLRAAPQRSSTRTPSATTPAACRRTSCGATTSAATSAVR